MYKKKKFLKKVISSDSQDWVEKKTKKLIHWVKMIHMIGKASIL